MDIKKEYLLLNPVFVEKPIRITNRHAISRIKEELKDNNPSIGDYILIRVDKMIYKLILEEKNQECFKFRLTSNIYV